MFYKQNVVDEMDKGKGSFLNFLIIYRVVYIIYERRCFEKDFVTLSDTLFLFPPKTSLFF